MTEARFETYPRVDGLIDWRLRAANGEVVATSHGQGFRDRTDAERSIRAAVYATLGVALGDNAYLDDADFQIVHLETGELGMIPGEETGDDAGQSTRSGEDAQADTEEDGDTEAGGEEDAE